MRDSNAPIINGFDCSGLVSRYSLRCEQFFAERGDTARTLDGASQTDVFPRKIRLSWTLNSVSSQQFADFNAALDTSDTINLVSAVAYDPTRDATCVGNFYVTRPAFPFALAVNGSPISQAGAELILDQQGALDWISVTPPNHLAYDIGDTFDSAGFRVTLTDDKDSVTDITSECSLSIADGDLLPDAGNIPVSVTRGGIQIGAFALSVGDAAIVAFGTWWTLYATGLLDIYCVGDMPTREWGDYLTQITSVVIRDSVTSIARAAFALCHNLTNVDIPNSVTSIDSFAFELCSSLTSVDIPDSVTSIGHDAFEYCSSLTSIVIPDSVTSIGHDAFSYCSSLVNVDIPNSVTSIGGYAFLNCSSLVNVDIPNSVTEIEQHTFSNCSSLASVTIQEGVTRIGFNVFEFCIHLTSVTIPDSVTSIAYRAFYNCTSLTSIVIPDSVTSIGNFVFEYCSSLTSVTISNRLTSIKDHTFLNCSRLASVIIPASVTSIEEYAFWHTALTSVTISRNCTVGLNAFPSGCVISYYEDEEAGT